MALRVVHVVAAFQHLEEFCLAGVFGRQALCDRHVAGLDVVLLHIDDHVIDCRDVMASVMIGKICRWGFDSGAAGQHCCCD